MKTRVLACALIVCDLMTTPALGETAAPKNRASDYVGCYRLAVASWSPRLDWEGDIAVPPETVELTGIRIKEFKTREMYVVKRAPGSKADPFAWMFWELTATGDVVLQFSTPMVGMGMKLTPKGSSLIGVASTFGDVDPGSDTHVAGA
jgi:hypothetical protein